MDHEAECAVSALDFHIHRKAFKSLVAEIGLPESGWVAYAEDLVRELTGSQTVEPELIRQMIRK